MKSILLVALILMSVSILAVWFLRRWRSTETDTTTSASGEFAIINRSLTLRSFLNDWQVTPQHDDRTPILVVRQKLSGYAPADRSTARRGHQRMYRQWSGGRHDYI